MVTDPMALVILCSISLAMETPAWYPSHNSTKRHTASSLVILGGGRTKYLQYYHSPSLAVVVCYSDILNHPKNSGDTLLLQDEINSIIIKLKQNHLTCAGERFIARGFYTKEKAIDFAKQNGTKHSLLRSPVHI